MHLLSNQIQEVTYPFLQHQMHIERDVPVGEKCFVFHFLLLHFLGVKILNLHLSHQNLRKMEEESSEEPGRDLNELQNADWVGLQAAAKIRLENRFFFSPSQLF